MTSVRFLFFSHFQCKLANTSRIRGKKLFNASKPQITLCHHSLLEMTASLYCMPGGYLEICVYLVEKGLMKHLIALP